MITTIISIFFCIIFFVTLPYQKKILNFYNKNGFFALLSKIKSFLKLNLINESTSSINRESCIQNIESQKKIFDYYKVPFQERLTKLTLHDEQKKVIYIDESPYSNSSRYRVYNVLEALEFSETWNGSYFYPDELVHLDSILHKVDIVIFARTRWSFTLNTFFNHVKKLNIPTVFDVDDLIFDINKVSLLMESVASEKTMEKHDFWFSYVSRMQMMFNMCDHTITTNDFLSKIITDTSKKKSWVIPNFLNNAQIDFSNDLYHQKLNNEKTAFSLGYFSGSASHQHDFNSIASEVAKFLNEHPDTTLNIVGYLDLPEPLTPFSKQIHFTPFVDYLTLQKMISEVDINLAPLVENEFTNSKSELKFFEAALVGTVTCATPTFAFKKNIENGVNSYLCLENEWYDTFKKIYHHRKSNMSSLARSYSIENYSPKNVHGTIERVLNGILNEC